MMRIKDLRDRILYTLGILIVYRIGCVIPIPGINISALKAYFNAQQSSGGGQIEMFLDFFSGGAFTSFSIFMLGIMPYISMSIIMQLVMIVFPRMKKLAEEEGGKKKITNTPVTAPSSCVSCRPSPSSSTPTAFLMPSPSTRPGTPYCRS